MAWGLVRKLVGGLVTALCLVAAAPAAAEPQVPSTCHAYSGEMLPVQQALTTLEWQCGDTGWQDGRGVTWLRFDEWDRAEPPLVFSSRISVFESVKIAGIGRDGTIRQRSYSPSEAQPVRAGPVFTLALPEARSDTESFVVAIEKPHSVTIGSEAGLYDDPESSSASLTAVILLAMVAGMLIMPLLFDILFFIVLRERSVLLHAAMTIAMITYVFTAGGVITAFATVPVEFIAIVGPLVWAVGVGFGGLFIAAFLERDALPPPLRRALTWCATWAMLVPGFCALQLEATQSFDNSLYFYAFVPVIPFYLGTVIYAALRGSRAARFLVAAWTPIMLASADRLLRGVGVYSASDSFDRAMFVALGVEVIIVALAIADRFVAIRRERDRALNEARSMEELSERDPLTGLLNRRGIEERFGALRAEGFTTMAVLDVDHFKAVNDRYGHSVGDAVLQALAEAIDPGDENTRAFRMGGEEFLLLLRGRNTLSRAEKLRTAITRAVRERDLVEERVTASMGLVEAPRGSLSDASFAALYHRADQLLYEAKSAGRDRAMSERLKLFQPRRGRERRAA